MQRGRSLRSSAAAAGADWPAEETRHDANRLCDASGRKVIRQHCMSMGAMAGTNIDHVLDEVPPAPLPFLIDSPRTRSVDSTNASPPNASTTTTSSQVGSREGI